MRQRTPRPAGRQDIPEEQLADKVAACEIGLSALHALAKFGNPDWHQAFNQELSAQVRGKGLEPAVARALERMFDVRLTS